MYSPSHLQDLAYGTIANPAGWQDLSLALRDTIQSNVAAAYTVDKRFGRISYFVGADGLDEPAQAAYESHFSRMCPWNDAAAAIRSGETLASSNETFTQPQYQEYFNDFWNQADLGHTLGLKVYEDRDTVYQIVVPRGTGQPAYTTSEKQILQQLYPAFSQNFTIAQQIQQARQAALQSQAVLDAIGHSLLVVDQSKRITDLNQHAETLLQQHNFLAIRREQLVIADLTLQQKLDELIGRALSQPDSGVTPIAGSLTLPDRSTLLVLPMRYPSATIQGRTIEKQSAIIVMLPPYPHVSTRTLLSKLYQLTPREVDITLMLARGNTSAVIARELGLSKYTVRTHIKRVQSKTSSRSQTELLAKLFQLARSS